jgi:type VI protein secretion system component Hcp
MKKTILLFVVVFISFVGTSALAQDFFLKIQGAPGTPYPGLIEGNSSTVGHEDEIKVDSWSQGISSCSIGSTPGNSQCKVNIQDFHFVMELIPAIIPLKYFATTGKLLSSVDMSAVKTGGDGRGFTYYKVNMENVLVSSEQEGGSDGGGTPRVQVSLSGQKIAWAIYEQTPTGAVTLKGSFGWDVAQNKIWNYTF